MRYADLHDRLFNSITGGKAASLLALAFLAAIVFNVGRSLHWWN